MIARHWRARASLENIKARANLYAQIRAFFAERNVLEVETPLLDNFGVTDVHLENITATHTLNKLSKTRYLQTSPEYAMKRLLAGGSGSIYQICKAFRNDEKGRLHHAEFSLLEWYRLGFSHHDLMDEMDLLLQTTLNLLPAERISYEELFLKHFSINPHDCTQANLIPLLKQHHINLTTPAQDFSCDDLLQLLLSHVIEPTLGLTQPTFLYDYPRTQAALAKIENNRAQRFEVYLHGIELANGFFELTDASTQLERFTQDNEMRRCLGLTPAPIDTRLIAALEEGLPTCSGVALGLDRLLMIKTGAKDIADVIAFAELT